MTTTHSSLWWQITAILCLASLGQSLCYYPNGTEASGFIPIDGDAEVSACCSPYDLFTNIGLCKSPFDGGNNWYWRNTCTDRSWNSSSCPQYCVDTDFDPRYANSDWPLIACSETAFCCAYNAEDVESTDEACCTDESRVLDIGPAKRVGGKIESTSLFPATATTSVFATSSTSQSSSRSASNTPSTTISTGLAGATSASGRTNSPAPSPARGLSSGAKAGISIGVAFGALLLIVAACTLLLRKRRRTHGRAAKQLSHNQQQHGRSDCQMGPSWPTDNKRSPMVHIHSAYSNDLTNRENTGGYYSSHQDSSPAGAENREYPSELDTERPPAEVPAGDALHNRRELPA
ncbi:hypothetical protein K431DRAFT_344202 [Polychaeton citri CBS 116435]|uniref:Uncharacterized protein n=1 Tax=Polychaeton citri CBS 116435 TaxID=1314669 RepID=A0A9P4QBD1_9PEZI|nr:hypothetical protein K431DRAFT_344202 [Polychaeton citri CBS 116435]